MTGVDRYSDALIGLRKWGETHNPTELAEAQVHATLAQAAASALQAILPLVGGDSEEVTAWARLLLPGYNAGRRYAFREWFDVLAEDAPDLPLKVGYVEVNTDETADGKPALDLGAGRSGARLTPADAERLGLALLKWAENPVGGKPPVPAEPANWPPQHGDIWTDRDGFDWLMESSGVLARIEPSGMDAADDKPNEINKQFGPLKLKARSRAWGAEVPF
jgi:hypothetical protein